jgi:hypothetical protein
MFQTDVTFLIHVVSRVARFFLVHYTKTGKNTEQTKNVPNGHKISKMSVKMTINILTFSNLRPSKNYPNWDFCFENKPSGNPDREQSTSVMQQRKHQVLAIIK